MSIELVYGAIQSLKCSLIKEMEKQKEIRHQDRQTMTQIDLDARAAVRAGPDGRDRVVEDKVHSGL